jgi:energy-coupling factor transporter transmembrane protein EcfT
MDGMISPEIAGALALAAIWTFAIARLWVRRVWSPLRPVVMVTVITASLGLMAEALLARAAGTPLPGLFWLAVFNLYMAIFDLRLSMALGRRGGLVVVRRGASAVEEEGAPA